MPPLRGWCFVAFKNVFARNCLKNVRRDLICNVFLAIVPSSATEMQRRCEQRLYDGFGSVLAGVYVEDLVIRISRALGLLLLFAVSVPTAVYTQSAATGQPFVVEYYYKTKWGHADEFLKLFKKNHYPLLKKEVEMGRMLKVWMDQPRYHTTEDGRWDFRVTIVFKNATVANEPFDETAIKKELWPDHDAYTREEQRRFEILDAHWDLPVKTVELDAKP
jgi:hypothetical protein